MSVIYSIVKNITIFNFSEGLDCVNGTGKEMSDGHRLKIWRWEVRVVNRHIRSCA